MKKCLNIYLLYTIVLIVFYVIVFRSPELKPIAEVEPDDLQAGLWNKISGRVKTYCKFPGKSKPKKNPLIDKIKKHQMATSLLEKAAESNDLNNKVATENDKNSSNQVDNNADKKQVDNKSKKDKKGASKGGKTVPQSGKKNILRRAGARLRTCFKRKKTTGPGLMARMNCFKARKRKTINKDYKPPFWKRLSCKFCSCACCSCSCCPSCKTCIRGNKAAPENNKKTGRKTSVGGVSVHLKKIIIIIIKLIIIKYINSK